jgi:hypothetical protein
MLLRIRVLAALALERAARVGSYQRSPTREIIDAAGASDINVSGERVAEWKYVPR